MARRLRACIVLVLLLGLAVYFLVGGSLIARRMQQSPGDSSVLVGSGARRSGSERAAATAAVTSCLADWRTRWRPAVERAGEAVQSGGASGGTCVRRIPDELMAEYTMHGQVPVVPWFKCQHRAGVLLRSGQAREYTREQIEANFEAIAEKRSMYYVYDDAMLYKAAELHPWRGKTVAIIGSQRPSFESVCIYYKAANCTTIEYESIVSRDARLATLTVDAWDAAPVVFDAAIAVSTFEHDGLGRYGDALLPDGDLRAMDKLRCLVKPGGLLYVAVPIARDKLVWNMHRIYGPRRLEKLLGGYRLVDVVGDYQLAERLNWCDSGAHGDYQPTFVLANEPQPHASYNMDLIRARFPPLPGVRQDLLKCTTTEFLTPSRLAVDDTWQNTTRRLRNG